MTPAQARYVRIETLVSAIINAALSIAFVLLIFGGQDRIAWRDLAIDALPQSFAIALMGTLVPTWLTRRRVRAGAVAPLAGPPTRLPRNPLLRALTIAVVVAGAAELLHLALLPLGPDHWPFAAVLGAKTVYGLVLGAGVGRFAVLNALRDRTPAG